MRAIQDELYTICDDWLAISECDVVSMVCGEVILNEVSEKLIPCVFTDTRCDYH